MGSLLGSLLSDFGLNRRLAAHSNVSLERHRTTPTFPTVPSPSTDNIFAVFAGAVTLRVVGPTGLYENVGAGVASKFYSLPVENGCMGIGMTASR